MRKIRVGVIFGGRSGEHEVSLVSAQSVMAALDPSRYDVVPIGITRQGQWLAGGDPMRRLQLAAQQSGRLLSPGGSSRPTQDSVSDSPVDSIAATVTTPYQALRSRSGGMDVVFPVLHGPFGEDGTIQGMLELAGIPYVGAGVLGSALGMDKIAQKIALRGQGLPVVDWVACSRKDWQAAPSAVVQRVETELGYPCFTKPANLGSSVGIRKAHHRAELTAGLDEAAGHDRRIIVEQAAVDCREIECSVLGNDRPEASLPGEVRPRAEFYDYAAKYVGDDTELVIPADLPAATVAKVQDLAVRAFLAIDCAGMARVDFFVSRDLSRIYVNELNTIPGFTAISMYPKLWEASGISYSRLLDRLIQLALERHAEKAGSSGAGAPAAETARVHQEQP